MKRRLQLIIFLLCIAVASAAAQNVTIRAVNQPAASVFRSLVEQTGKNFVYSSELLKDVNVTVSAQNRPLKTVLAEMFRSTDIEFRIKGDNVILKRKKHSDKPRKIATTPAKPKPITVTPPPAEPKMLEEIVVVSRLESPAVETAEIGARKVTALDVRNTPALFGEPDVIRALHTQPGVSEGGEGMAGMHVHGGDADENLYMLDNVPLYQVNHFAGLFSAFNPDIIRYIDFFKSSMPAKYEGRLSSFMDVRLKNGSTDGHHGSARLGLTSGAFNISGPIGQRTTYLVGLRRSWYDVITIPALAILNSAQPETTRFQYYFMDLNAKVTHRFSNRATAFASVYFGDDMLKTGWIDEGFKTDNFLGSVEDDRYDYHWGNLVAQCGLNYRLTSAMTAEFTAAYTRYFTSLRHHDIYKDSNGESISITDDLIKTNNNINDWIFRGDFDWQPTQDMRVRFGANYVRHSFLPARTSRISIVDETRTESRDSTWAYHANELNAYIEDDWHVTDRLRLNAGFHASLFNIDGKVKYGLSPRLSVSYRPVNDLAIKGAYSHTTQYVHQLAQSYISLPTDQWIPVTGNFKPQTTDKISLAAYWQIADKAYVVSVEGYYKWLHNLLDYRDEYYLRPPLEMWNARLTQGHGRAKGIDFMIEKIYGKFTGHISYSLAWADRTFPGKNGGLTYPARFDNRHTINILVNWNVNDKVTLNASWTGHSGNHFTLLTQMWGTPLGTNSDYENEAPLRAPINNYQLPFYHRLDLSCTVRNKRGFWSFGLYNAYNHLNVIGVKRGYTNTSLWAPDHYWEDSKPVFQKVKFLPIIPSISYTWEF